MYIFLFEMASKLTMQCLKFGLVLVLLSTSLVSESSAQEGENNNDSPKNPDPTTPSPPAGATVTGHNG